MFRRFWRNQVLRLTECKKIFQLNKEVRRRLVSSFAPGLAFGLLMRLGAVLAAGGSIGAFGWKDLFIVLVYVVWFTSVCYVLLSFVSWRTEAGVGERTFEKRRFFIIWLALFFAWLPAFLAYYPTIWAYDVPDQLPSIRGRTATTHHPLLHTLYLQTVVQIGSRPGNFELGMALLSLSQMLGLSGMFSYGIESTRSWGSGKLCRGLLFCFFAFFPVNPILSVSMTKDVLFSGCWLVLSVKLYDMADAPENFFASWKKQLSFVVFLCFMLALRSNAIYAFVPGIFLAVCLFGKLGKSFQRKLILLAFGGIAASLILQGSLFVAMRAEKGEAQEAFCVPMQCLVGTAVRHPELVPEFGTGQELFGIVPRDLFPEKFEKGYDPHLADLAKMRWLSLSQEEFDPGELLKTWISYGVRYPADYIDIWGNLTLGAWYPLDVTHAQIYDKYEGPRQGYLLTDYKYVSEIGMERPPSKWPAMERLYEKIATENIHQKIPVISLLFAPASYCWVLFFCIVLALYRKRYLELVPLGLIFFLWATVMLGPTVLVRYLYPAMVMTPLVLSRLSIRLRSFV